MKKLCLSLLTMSMFVSPVFAARAKAAPAPAGEKAVSKKAGKAYTEITSEAQYLAALKSSGVVVIKFYSPTCPPCKMMAPEFEKTAKEMQHDATFLSIDATKKDAFISELASAFNVSAFPTTVIINKKAGFMDAAALSQEVNNALGRKKSVPVAAAPEKAAPKAKKAGY